MKAVIYARYSSHTQREESIEDQSTTRFGGFLLLINLREGLLKDAQ